MITDDNILIVGSAGDDVTALKRQLLGKLSMAVCLDDIQHVIPPCVTPQLMPPPIPKYYGQYRPHNKVRKNRDRQDVLKCRAIKKSKRRNRRR